MSNTDDRWVIAQEKLRANLSIMNATPSVVKAQPNKPNVLKAKATEKLWVFIPIAKMTKGQLRFNEHMKTYYKQVIGNLDNYEAVFNGYSEAINGCPTKQAYINWKKHIHIIHTGAVVETKEQAIERVDKEQCECGRWITKGGAMTNHKKVCGGKKQQPKKLTMEFAETDKKAELDAKIAELTTMLQDVITLRVQLDD